MEEPASSQQTAAAPRLGMSKFLGRDWLADVYGVLLAALQFGLLILVIWDFQVKDKAFLYLIVYVAFPGFLIHHFLPMRFRMPFFVGLSVAGVAVVLGLGNAAWLLALGMLLIGVAHVPVPFKVRIPLLVLTGGVLAVLRGEWFEDPVPGAVWPILGSMFMFRFLLYVYDLRHQSAPFSFWRATSYFFMLPNVCFPLFPVVDYKAFCRSHYNDEPFPIYQTGLIWIFRGVIHLLLYRLVYQNMVIDPATITNAEGATRYIFSTYLLYLRVSGDFHIIVGIMHLFGFNLSETHHLYLLSSSFIDFWRRINIYWKDFIQKMFFNPVYFKANRKMGPTAAMTVATFLAFLATWMLHQYQWFWIRDTFPFIWQDAVFWTFLAVIVWANMLYDAKKSTARRRNLKKSPPTAKSEIHRALSTIGTFVVICTSWTLWTSQSLDELLSTLSHLTVLTPLAVAWTLGVLVALGVAAAILGRKERTQTDALPAGRTTQLASPRSLWRPAVQVLVGSCLILVLGRYSSRVLSFQPQVVVAVDNLKSPNRLSARDKKLLERGYYEDLTDVVRFNAELAGIYRDQPANWKEDPMIRATPEDYPPFGVIESMEVEYRGAPLTTNRWGLRDRDYEKAKPAGTFRIALLGASHAFGTGIRDDETFENLVEDRLNRELPGGPRFEILNFAVGGYGPLSRLAVLKNQVLDFEPDAILYVGIDDHRWIINELANAVDRGFKIPYVPVAIVLKETGVENGLARILAEQKLEASSQAVQGLLRWTYGEFVAECRLNDISPFAVFIPRPERRPERAEYFARQREFAAGAGLTVLDEMLNAYDTVEDLESLWIAPWDRHPNAEGHQLLAAAIYERLLPHLSDAGRSSSER